MFKYLLLISVLLKGGLVYSKSFEGGGSTGGGGSFVCKKDGIITSAVQLDIWDLQRSFTLVTSSLNEKDLARQRVATIPNESSLFRKEVLAQLEIVFKKRRILPYKIRNVGDSRHVFEVGACESGEPSFEQAAIYEGDKLTYSSFIWEKMDNVSQAGLDVHEAVYKILRDEYGEKTSERTIKIVAYLFAELPDPLLKEEIPTDSYNPFSSKSYDARYRELLDYFLKGKEVRFSDINKDYDKCLSLNSLSDRYPYNLTPDFKIAKKYSKNGKFRGATGNISFKEKADDIIFGRVRFTDYKSQSSGFGEFGISNKFVGI